MPCLLLITLLTIITTAVQAQRPTPPTRDPATPGYVKAATLPDDTNAPPKSDGNFILGPTHTPSPDTTPQPGVPQGTIIEFTMNSADSKLYPGIARDPGTFGTPDPNDPAKLIVTTSHPAPYTRKVAVYVPAQYVPGTAAPFIVGADGPDKLLFTTLDNLIAQHRVPAMVAISIGNGSGDAQGSERGLEYDTMSPRYAEFVQTEVLPLVEQKAHVKLTSDPNGRATMGGSSGGSCALIMAWYHPEWYHRVLTYSGTYVNQQWPPNPETPHGAWEFHEHLIPNTPRKPIRLWLEVGDRDNLNSNAMRDNMHDWVVANENMARVLAAKHYHYQFVFAKNAGHTDRAVKQQTLPEALEYLWQGYPITPIVPSSPYAKYTQSYTIPWLNSPNFSNLTSLLKINAKANNGPIKAFTIDTGSVGVVLPASDVPNIPANSPHGSLTYSSSGLELDGVWATVPITFTDAIPTGGSVTTATAVIPVLAVTTSKCTGVGVNAGSCTGLVPHQLGIGFGRGTDVQESPVYNPVLNLTDMTNTTMRRGYLIERDGLHLGLTATNVTSGFGMQTLTSAGTPSAGSHNDWQTPTGGFSIGNGALLNGAVLMDTGLLDMILEDPSLPSTGSVLSGTPMKIVIGTHDYLFTVGDGGPSTPTIVNYAHPTKTFVNTGLRALAHYNLLYDADGGLFGLSYLP
jgi:enterochelin esterase-like enzyme